MADSRTPVVIDQEADPKPHSSQEKKSGYIRDSASRITTIAQTYGLDALLQKDPPQKPPSNGLCCVRRSAKSSASVTLNRS